MRARRRVDGRMRVGEGTGVARSCVLLGRAGLADGRTGKLVGRAGSNARWLAHVLARTLARMRSRSIARLLARPLAASFAVAVFLPGFAGPLPGSCAETCGSCSCRLALAVAGRAGVSIAEASVSAIALAEESLFASSLVFAEAGLP